MDSLADRMAHVLKVRNWSAREWARKAGLKSEAHVSLIVRTKRDQAELKTLGALAHAAGVSLEWLALGKGSPFSGALEITPDPHYPTRAQAIAAAHLIGYTERAIAEVLAIDELKTDPGVDYWLTLLRAKNLEHAQHPTPAKKSARKR